MNTNTKAVAVVRSARLVQGLALARAVWRSTWLLLLRVEPALPWALLNLLVASVFMRVLLRPVRPQFPLSQSSTLGSF